MDPKHLTAVIVSAILGVILLVTVVAPIVSEGMKTTGDPVTYTNSLTSTNQYRYDYVNSVELTATASETANISYDFVINGNPITLINDYMLAVASDGIVIQIGTAGQFAYSTNLETYVSEPNLSPTTYPTVTLTMVNGEWSLNAGDTVLKSGVYTWIVTYKENGRYVAHNGSVTGAYCYETPKDFIVYGGGYSTGDLDSFYAYGNGKLTVGVTEYTGALNWNVAKVDGTTDIYRITTCNLTVTDGENSETFTPYRCLYLYEVTGHATSGSLYSMLGIIPIVVAIGIVLGVVSMAIVNRYD